MMEIYFIQCGEVGPVKIGITNNIPARMLYLQTAHYESIHLIRSFSGSRGEEQWLHQRFRDQHIRGEWFHLVPEMLTILPEQHADLTRLGRQFLDCKFALIDALTNRPDLSYRQIADMLDIPSTRFYGWVRVLQTAGLAPIRISPSGRMKPSGTRSTPPTDRHSLRQIVAEAPFSRCTTHVANQAKPPQGSAKSD